MNYTEYQTKSAEIGAYYRQLKNGEQRDLRLEYYRQEFSWLETIDLKDRILVNGVGLTKFGMDRYNNVAKCDFTPSLPLRELRAVARLVCDIYESDYQKVYRYRAIQGLFIRYWETFFMSLSAKDLIELLEIAGSFPCERNDRKRQGFYSWLLTRTYCGNDGGNLKGPEFRTWGHFADFAELLKDFDDKSGKIPAVGIDG